jgi:hypothetical protein
MKQTTYIDGDLIINHSINIGIIKGVDFVGGFIGGSKSTTSSVKITHSSTLGSIEGPSGKVLGGLIAYSYTTEINNSFNITRSYFVSLKLW